MPWEPRGRCRWEAVAAVEGGSCGNLRCFCLGKLPNPEYLGQIEQSAGSRPCPWVAQAAGVHRTQRCIFLSLVRTASVAKKEIVLPQFLGSLSHPQDLYLRPLPKNCRVEIYVVGYLYFLPAWSKVNRHLLKYWHGANVGTLLNKLDQSSGFLKHFVSSCF